MILLTAHGEFEFARQAIQYGVIDYILKPITREKIRLLNELLVRKQEQLMLRRMGCRPEGTAAAGFENRRQEYAG